MQNFLLEQHDQIAILKVNRPQALNALNEETLTELLEFLEKESAKDSLRALILTGAGDKAFIAGADIKAMQGMSALQMLQFCRLGQRVGTLLESAPFLTLAAVNGYALGGGLEIALACDFIYSAHSAKMGFPEVTLGIIPGFGGTQRSSRAIGTRQAKELIMSGKTITADQAFQIGMVNRVCDDDQLIPEALAAAAGIAKHSKTAVTQSKNAIQTGYPLSMGDALELERNMCAVCFGTPDRFEAMTAFVEKRSKS